ncbi:MAG: glycosyl transferase [Bacteroidetes bacterium]|nr:MAG: glycosyl transferase [Bacteroidota bacterium]
MTENVRSRKKLVAFVSNSAWSVYNFRLDVIRHLKQRFDILIIAPDDAFSSMLVQEGCRFIPIEFNNRSENPFLDFRLYQQLKKIYRKEGPDFIFHYVIKPNIYGSMAAASFSIKSVAIITGLGYSFAKKNWLYRIARLLYKRALKKAEEIWFLNNEDAGIFTKERIVPIEKIKVLPGEGINTDFFSNHAPEQHGQGSFHFLMSTRLLKSKGVRIYADAARILKRKNYDAVFTLIGFFEKHHPDSVAEEELRKWQEEGLLQYKGFARDVRPFLEKADCFVLPSFYNEGVPRSLMEAASMELPILTSFNRGCKEVVIDNQTGYTCRLNDPFDLADKMEKIINLSAEERNRMGKAGRDLVVKKFKVEKVIAEYERTLDRI